MKFYNREEELALLGKIGKMSQSSAQMTFVTGRRRIGKTSLLIKSNEQNTCLYFFIAKKNEALLCAEFTEEITKNLHIPLFGEIKSIRELLVSRGRKKYAD